MTITYNHYYFTARLAHHSRTNFYSQNQSKDNLSSSVRYEIIRNVPTISPSCWNPSILSLFTFNPFRSWSPLVRYSKILFTSSVGHVILITTAQRSSYVMRNTMFKHYCRRYRYDNTRLVNNNSPWLFNLQTIYKNTKDRFIWHFPKSSNVERDVTKRGHFSGFDWLIFTLK